MIIINTELAPGEGVWRIYPRNQLPRPMREASVM